jgi:hypothetical protein
MNDALLIAGLTIGSIRLFYWIAIAAVLAVVLWFPKKWWHKTGLSVLALAAFSYLPAKEGQKNYEAHQYRKAAWAHFKKRCDENAGEKIYKTAENVEGIYLMRPRPKATEAQLRDQYWMGDPYGYRHGVNWQDTQVFPFLWNLNESGGPVTTLTERTGFKFIEAPDPSKTSPVDGSFTQYRLDPESRKLIETTASKRQSIYGITWEDISTREDRDLWVAGSKFQIVDLLSKEVVAERIGYLIESGFGSTGQGGARTAWDAATVSGSACPPFERFALIDRLFVEKVLKPSKREFHAK